MLPRIVRSYTGSDPQLVSSLTMPTGGKERHSLAMVGVVYGLYCLDRTATLNSGLVRPESVCSTRRWLDGNQKQSRTAEAMALSGRRRRKSLRHKGHA